MTSPREVPTWTAYFLAMAKLASTRSKHPRSQHGAVLVSEDHRVVSTGYNGTPRAFPENVVDWSSGMTWTNKDWTIHAEENALLYAGRKAAGCILYVTGVPCPRCMLRIVHCGVIKTICGESTYSKEASDREVLCKILEATGAGVFLFADGRQRLLLEVLDA